MLLDLLVEASSAYRSTVQVYWVSLLRALVLCAWWGVLRVGELVPKTPSTALYLELLDAAGAPTWMARDVQQLVQLAQSKQPEPRQQQQQRNAAGPPEQQPAGSDRSDSDGSDSGAESEGQACSKQHPEEEDEVDVDTLLAQAAAEVCVACRHELWHCRHVAD
jgi:hypothetical protein